jgi:hypothetical protein
MEGLAIVKSGRGRPDIDRNALLTFVQISDGYHEFPEPQWAVVLEIDDTQYIWHVTKIRPCGKSTIVMMKANPHPVNENILAPLPNAVSGPTNIRIILNHNPDNPFVVVTGRGVLFVGRTVVPL